MSMMTRIEIDAFGGPEEMHAVERPIPELAPGQILVRHEAIGVNFIDTYHRTGLYPVPLPSGLGGEGAGIVEAMGADVSHFRVGDRVAYCSGRSAPMPATMSSRQTARCCCPTA